MKEYDYPIGHLLDGTYTLEVKSKDDGTKFKLLYVAENGKVGSTFKLLGFTPISNVMEHLNFSFKGIFNHLYYKNKKSKAQVNIKLNLKENE
jgi:hypothetical protein